MDFAIEEQLCRHAHDVWRQVAAEPGRVEHDASGSVVPVAARPRDASARRPGEAPRRPQPR